MIPNDVKLSLVGSVFLNLSALSSAQVQMIRATLRGDVVQPVNQTFEVIASPAHGHVQAVCLAMQRLGFASMLAAKPCRERDLVLAMVASRIISPATKLATTRLWRTNTLAQEFGVSDANEAVSYTHLVCHQLCSRVERGVATRESV